MIPCPHCRWFRTPFDKLAKAIVILHLRAEHGYK